MKLAILGGAGTRAMILVKSLVNRARELQIGEIVFMDIDHEGLRIFGAMAQKAGSLIDPGIKITCTDDAVSAVAAADYVITTIRVGREEARVQDERIALQYGVLGQETTGAGGFAMAMRSIPEVARYCALIRQYAKPDVMVFNFTNPAGLVTQAMRDLGYDFVYGICDAPSGFLHQLAKLRDRRDAVYSMDAIGLNHLSYYTRICENGNDITKEIIGDPNVYTDTDMRYFSTAFPQRLGMCLNEYLYYYYYREQALQNILDAKITRGEAIKQVNDEMFAALRPLGVETDFQKMLDIFSFYNYKRTMSYMANESHACRTEKTSKPFDMYTPDDGGYAGVALALIRAKQSGKTSEMILCVPNNGTVDWLRDSDVIEVTCTIGPEGATPKKNLRDLDGNPRMLVQLIKHYERQAVSAILTRDTQLAIEALTLHPLVNSYSIAEKLVCSYIEAHALWIGRWT